MRTTAIFILLGALCSTGGCMYRPILLSGPNISYATTAEDSDAKAFRSDPQKAAIYVYRENHFEGSGVVLPVFLDGRLLGSIGSGCFAYVSLEPKTYIVRVITVESAEDVVVEAKAGMSVFIRAETRMGVAGPRASLSEVVDVDGMKGVSNGRMIRLAYIP